MVTAQAFQAKGQLVPDLVRDDLVVRVLHDKADLGGLVLLVHLIYGNAAEQNLSAALAVGRQHGFQVPQEGGFPAAALAAEDHILPFFNAERHPAQGFLFRVGVRKAQILDMEMRHWRASLMCSAVGMERNTQ